MKKRVILKKIFHREGTRIAIVFDYDDELRKVAGKIPGVRFSGTHRCYYVDDTEENFELLRGRLKDAAEVEIDPSIERLVLRQGEGPRNEGTVREKSGQLPREDDPGLSGQARVERVIEKESSGDSYFRAPYASGSGGFGPVEFRIDEKEGFLVIRFMGKYDPTWISEMKTYGRCFYDKIRREWSLRWSKITCDSLADYFTSNGVKLSIKKNVVDTGLSIARKETGDGIRSRELIARAADALDSFAMFMDENRYSSRTRESYLSILDLFFRYFTGRDPMDISEEEISAFIYDFIIRLGYSASYQNQIISAIKTFYTISGKGRVNPEFLERPRRSRALPKVFSKEEVSRILNSGRNIKHKLLLWMIYSCGLRRSEVTNIRLEDLDRDRGLLFIREGKGKVDRIVPVSQKVWEKIDEYSEAFQPGHYLFEGQSGGRYSSESVYRVFKGALKRAGIMKEVGVHSLRHSYATHLHENGLDIRYIQELLGHKSTRTTEIYTHVSRRNLIQVRSPIEDLDVK